MIAGTRKSRLAVIQTQMVLEEIGRVCPQEQVKILGMDTRGDRNLVKALADFGGKGAFTQEIETAMLAGEIDLAVHSAKDLPLEMPKGLEIAAVIQRGDQRDVWVSRIPECLEGLPSGTIAGTGSKRRSLQLLEINSHLEIRNIRGNVETRLRKLADGEYAGIILAAAGLKRLQYLAEDCENQGSFEAAGHKYYYRILDPELFLPAAGQGIIAVEAPAGSNADLFKAITDSRADLAFTAERAFLEAIGGSCNAAAAIYTRFDDGNMKITAKYAPDNLHMLKTTLEIMISLQKPQENHKAADEAGRRAALSLLGMEVPDGR